MFSQALASNRGKYTKHFLQQIDFSQRETKHTLIHSQDVSDESEGERIAITFQKRKHAKASKQTV